MTSLRSFSPVKRKIRKRFIVLASLVAFLVILFQLTDLSQFTSFDGIIHWVEEARRHPSTVTIFYIGFSIGIMFLPITIFPIIGGVLAGFNVAVLLNLFAATAGATFSFILSRYMARDLVTRHLEKHIKKIDHKASRQGFKTVVLLRLIGVPPFIVTNYVLGLSSIKLKDYVLGTLIGIFPWMIFITYLSSHLWEAILVGGKAGLTQALISHMKPLMILSAGVVCLVGINMYLKYRQSKKNYSNL